MTQAGCATQELRRLDMLLTLAEPIARRAQLEVVLRRAEDHRGLAILFSDDILLAGVIK